MSFIKTVNKIKFYVLLDIISMLFIKTVIKIILYILLHIKFMLLYLYYY